MSEAQNRNLKKTRTGVVITDKMDKTVVVEHIRRVAHPMYGKYMKRRVRFKAHDERNDCRVGDTVLIEESRPLSKSKHWRVTSIIKRAELAG